VMGARAVRAAAADRAESGRRGSSELAASPAVPIAARTVVQQAMSGAAGIGRTAGGLAAASDAVEAATTVAVPVDRAGVEDAALTLLAQAVLAAAGTRTESRGCHVRTDFPDRDDSWQRESLVVRLDDTGRPVVAPSAPVSAAPC
jgi:L-aspartate oxidase